MRTRSAQVIMLATYLVSCLYRAARAAVDAKLDSLILPCVHHAIDSQSTAELSGYRLLHDRLSGPRPRAVIHDSGM